MSDAVLPPVDLTPAPVAVAPVVTVLDYAPFVIASGQTKSLPLSGSFALIDLTSSGSFFVSVDGGTFVPARKGQKIMAPAGGVFSQLAFRAVTASVVNVIFGNGDYNLEQAATSGGGGGTVNMLHGPEANPNGVYVPDDPLSPALYAPDGAPPASFWWWDVVSAAWQQMI